MISKVSEKTKKKGKTEERTQKEKRPFNKFFKKIPNLN